MRLHGVVYGQPDEVALCKAEVSLGNKQEAVFVYLTKQNVCQEDPSANYKDHNTT